ncbi:MAG: outer membrane protein assembly factor BamD [Bacteroidia bacterium]|nr:outer membrane protein assembly factor BamD [Bacteroidia bacterium]MCZ2277306.1 outer membrane protein assembly factor BamD [Bacteroidia bacterium]
MLKQSFRVIAAVLAAIFLLTGCSQFNRIMKSTDNELKYQAALRYYAEGKYFQSMQLLDELIVAYRATNKAEEVYYYYAKSFYGTGDYVSAAYHFSNFCKTYPSSKYAEECQFLNAYCYYLDSPVYSLDQKSTLDAIQQFQLFINKYPSSEKIPECNKLIDELRFKIETKNFQYAKLFYRMEDYRAAAIAFTAMAKTYPASDYVEESLFLALKSTYLFAHNSIESKREERYKDAIETYFQLTEKFPQGKFQKEADRIFDEVKKQLTLLESDKSVNLSQN